MRRLPTKTEIQKNRNTKTPKHTTSGEMMKDTLSLASCAGKEDPPSVSRKRRIMEMADLSSDEDWEESVPQVKESKKRRVGEPDTTSTPIATFLQETITSVDKLINKKVASVRQEYEERLKDKDARLAELKSEIDRITGMLSNPFPYTLRFVYKLIGKKMKKAYEEELQRLRETLSSNYISMWFVALDEGSSKVLPEEAQVCLSDSSLEEWTSEYNKDSCTTLLVFKNAFSVTVGQRTQEYDLLWTESRDYYQRNASSLKCRSLFQRCIPPEEWAGIEMNSFSVPLSTKDGDFLFREELEAMEKYGKMSTLCMSCPNSTFISKIAAQFDAPFNVFEEIDPAKCTAYVKPFLLFNFLLQAKTTWETNEEGSCFLWAHGTKSSTFIETNPLGMDIMKSKSENWFGKGVYVSGNAYVPTHWAMKEKNSAIVFGIALRNTSSFNTSCIEEDMIQQYRMSLNSSVNKEPSIWSSNDVPHAICIKNPSELGVLPLGHMSLGA
jgi:hypothetical protein